MDIFEVDHPATQEFKLQRLQEWELTIPENVHFVPADLGVESLDATLARSSFRPADRSFFSWLGVAAYLTREANLGTLRAMAGCSAPGSEVVFTYLDQRVFEENGPPHELRGVQSAVASLGEPWVSGFHPPELADVLRGVGLTLVDNLGHEELTLRYCKDRDDGLRLSPMMRIPRAAVG